MTFDLSYEEVDEVESFLAFKGSVLLIAADGYLEFGPVVQYLRTDVEGEPSLSGTGLGPRIEINLLPSKPATPFLSGSLLFFGEELADIVENEISIGIGFKAFPGDSAAFRVAINKVTRQGADRLPDVDSLLLTAGLSLLFGH